MTFGRCRVCGAPDDHPSYRDAYAHLHAGHPRSILGSRKLQDGVEAVFMKTDLDVVDALCGAEPPDAGAIPHV